MVEMGSFIPWPIHSLKRFHQKMSVAFRSPQEGKCLSQLMALFIPIGPKL